MLLDNRIDGWLLGLGSGETLRLLYKIYNFNFLFYLLDSFLESVYAEYICDFGRVC